MSREKGSEERASLPGQAGVRVLAPTFCTGSAAEQLFNEGPGAALSDISGHLLHLGEDEEIQACLKMQVGNDKRWLSQAGRGRADPALLSERVMGGELALGGADG